MKPAQVWQPPTRRTFVALLGAAAAALVVKLPRPAPPAVAPLPRWIGHA